MILNGWKEIATYVNSSVRTVQRWEKMGLPVVRPVPGSRGSVIAYSDQLDTWLVRMHEKPESLAATARREIEFAEGFYENLLQARALTLQLRESRVEMSDRVSVLKAELSRLNENMIRMRLAANRSSDGGSLPVTHQERFTVPIAAAAEVTRASRRATAPLDLKPRP